MAGVELSENCRDWIASFLSWRTLIGDLVPEGFLLGGTKSCLTRTISRGTIVYALTYGYTCCFTITFGV